MVVHGFSLLFHNFRKLFENICVVFSPHLGYDNSGHPALVRHLPGDVQAEDVEHHLEPVFAFAFVVP